MGISRYDLKKWVESEHNKLDICLSEDEESVLIRSTGKVLCSVDEFVLDLRKKTHCDFESIYYEHATLDEVIRCRECGTVIFTGDDDRWDPNLCCPVCGGYKTSLEYWSGEEIARDEEKQKAIAGYEWMQNEKRKEYERRERRGGKYDWQIWTKIIYGEKHCYNFELKCDNLFRNKWPLKGLEFEIRIGDRDESFLHCKSYIYKRTFVIPLSWRSFYIRYIFRHTKRWKECCKKMGWSE